MGLLDNKSSSPNFSVEQQACLNSTPTPVSNSSIWQQWHMALVKCFGKSGANSVWVMAWDRYGQTSSSAYSTALAQYMQSQGVEIASSGGKNVALASANVLDFFGGHFNFMKTLSWVVGGGIALGFLMLLYTLIVNPDKAKKSMSVVTEGVTQGALLATPQGRAITATGLGTKSITG
jgi:hypothetical protein